MDPFSDEPGRNLNRAAHDPELRTSTGGFRSTRSDADTPGTMKTRQPPLLRQDDVLATPPAEVRRILSRVLAALPCQTGNRVTILPILLRRMPDSALPRLARMVRCEVSSQRRWLELLAAQAPRRAVAA
jgi:hypothetical protein